jgi:hypothetical protein
MTTISSPPLPAKRDEAVLLITRTGGAELPLELEKIGYGEMTA